jgi:hypothetical protein
MARLPRALTTRIQRRRDARAPRVVVRDRTGIPHTLDPAADPSAQALVEATERLILAVQSGSERS